MSDVPSSPPSRIKVAFNALHAKSGGGITYLRNLLPALAKDPAFELHLFIHHSQLADFAALPTSIQRHALACPTGFFSLLAWEQLSLPAVIGKTGADVVVSPANYGPLRLKRHVIVLQNSLAVGSCETRWRKRLYWWALGVMTAVSLMTARAAVAVSAYVAKTAGGVPTPVRAPITVIHHGVSALFHPDDGPRQNFLLAVGDLYVQKNFETLITAFHTVSRTRPGLRLKIAGRPLDPDYATRLHRLVHDLELGAKVEFLGSCPAQTVAELYRRCAVFVFPSVEESFGMPVVEAMASGCAVACSDAAAMPEVAGDAALYFNPSSAAAMAAAIEALLDDDTLRREHAARALARATLFDWDRTARCFGDLLRHVSANARPPSKR